MQTFCYASLNMNLNQILAIIAICGINVLHAAVVKPQNQDQEKHSSKTPWDLEEAIYESSGNNGFNGTWVTDNEFYYKAKDKSIHKFNAALNSDSIFLNSSFLRSYLLAEDFTFSPDNTKILVKYLGASRFSSSFVSKYSIYDIATQKSIEIHHGENLQYWAWSPKKNRLAYVYNNNVFIYSEENSEVQITSDGINCIFYNGVPDWVYNEEVLSSGSAIWWSDDGNFLAVGVFDDTKVETYKYFFYGEADDPQYQYPEQVNLKYPKPGTNNPVVALKVFDISNGTTNVTIKAPVEVVGNDNILQSVAWTGDRKLLITWLNRRQNIASLQLCGVLGECHEIKRIEEPKGWVAIGNPLCLKNEQNCLFSYWINNWYQIWNLDLQTGENVWNSRGNFTVLQVYGYDELNDKIYYQATLDSDPSVYQVFSNSDCLTCNLTDEDGEKCLSASASFSKGYSFYTVICSGPNPLFTKIFETKTNREVKNWEPNSHFRVKLASKLRPRIEFIKVPLADGSTGMAKLQFPPNLHVTKQYPMIIYVYGGPNSVRVVNSFGVGFDAYMTTNRQIIYVQIDGRGTDNKGKDLLFSVNNHLGEFEVEDQIHVTKYLQNLFPYVDKNRCGIWGWSYGGYMTARTLANDTDRVFQCGISVAPVTSWLYYDSIYTERYMGMPGNNLEKYLNTSVLQQVDNFRNHDFMLIHGSGDDNVHYQQSLMLAKVLQANDIMFKEMIYTDENHAIGKLHLYHSMDQFWNQCLNLDLKSLKSP